MAGRAPARPRRRVYSPRMNDLLKVMLFDDELAQQPGPYRMSGLSLRCFAHADDAVQLVAAELPDVVLMDYSMGAMLSGAAAVAKLRALSLGQATSGPARGTRRRLRIVAISSDPANNQRMLDAGADDAVPKSHVRAYLHKLLEYARLQQQESHIR